MEKSIPSPTLRLTVSLMATLFALTAIGCAAGEVDDGSGAVENKLSVNCPAKTDPWTIGRAYKVGELVSFQGGVFQCRQAHTPVDGWFPNIVPALWTPVQCTNSTPTTPPAPQPPASPPPVTQPPVTQPPAPPAGGQCQASGAPGPKFDPAGAKNVGNGQGVQFIGGQCLRAADCASACCALPCGICSGPGAQFQAGKQGCGFGG